MVGVGVADLDSGPVEARSLLTEVCTVERSESCSLGFSATEFSTETKSATEKESATERICSRRTGECTPFCWEIKYWVKYKYRQQHIGMSSIN